MPSKGGSSPAGSTTVNQISTPWNADALRYIQGVTQHLYQDNPTSYYPGQTLATQNPAIAGGYQGLINQGYGGAANTLTNNANSAFNNVAGGSSGVGNSPAYSGLYSNAYGFNPNENQALNYASGLGSFGQSAAVSGQNYGSLISQLAGMAPSMGGNAGGYIASLAPNAFTSAGQYADLLRNAGITNSGQIASLAGMAPSVGGNAGAYVSGLAPATIGSSSNLGNQLTNLSGQGLSGIAGNVSRENDLSSQMWGTGSAYAPWIASQATQPASVSSALNSLLGTANGNFLGNNPYLDRQYKAASDPLVRAYQTATAPQTDANYEAAGRYGSGALMNARSQNEQNLGNALGDLSANLYGTDYANERSRMVTAAQAAGGLGLSSAAQAASILGSAANTSLASNTAAANTSSDAARNYLSGLNLAQTGLMNAGNLINSGYQGAGNLASTGAGLNLAGLNAGLAGLTNASNVFNSGVQGAGNLTQSGALNAGNLGAQGANLGLSGLQAGMTGYGNAGNMANAGYLAGMGGYAAGGTLTNNVTGQQNTALNNLQSGYQAGNTNLLQALQLSPNLINNNYGLSNAIIQGGQGLTGLDQQQITDQMRRFYGEQLAPWQTAQMAAGFIGGPYAPSVSQTQPYFSNPTANALSGLSGGVGLLNQLGGLGSLGSLFGGAGGTYGGGAALGAGFGSLGEAVNALGAGSFAGEGVSLAPETLAALGSAGEGGGFLSGLGSLFAFL